MKTLQIRILLYCFFFLSVSAFSQNYSFKKKFGTQKNTVYIYWGYNRSIYSKSDINFYGPEYNFTASAVRASDRPSRDFATYIDPKKFTVPQFNVRIGWYYKFRWDFSVGYDHMKYVMNRNQSLYLNGNTGNTTNSELNGVYTSADGLIKIREDDLHYENTNGLNYVSVQLNNTAPIWKARNNSFALQRRLGIGLGPVISQTDFNWDGQVYNSEFKQKFGGYGVSLHTGFRFDIFNRFFFQSNWSGGFIHLPKNATVLGQDQYARHKFVYAQWELLGGVLFYIRTKNGCNTCPDWH